MATIGTLTTIIDAKTKPFERGMKRSQAANRGFAESSNKAGASTAALTKRLIGAAAAALSVHRAIGVMNKQMSEVDEISKTSDKLGIATERLVGLQFAAEQTGVTTTTLDMALQRMTRRVAEAAMGTGEAVKALKELGLDAKSLAGQAPDMVFRQIADRMQLVANQSDKVRLAMKLFDSEGVALVNTLALGTVGLDDMQEQAASLGATFTRLEGKQVEAANEAVTRFKVAMDGMVRQATIYWAPALEKVADAFTSVGKAADRPAGQGERTPQTDAVTGRVDRLTRRRESIEAELAALNAERDALPAALRDVMDAYSRGDVAIGQRNTQIERLRLAIVEKENELRTATLQISTAMNVVTRQSREFGSALGGAAVTLAIKTRTDAIKEQATAIANLARQGAVVGIGQSVGQQKQADAIRKVFMGAALKPLQLANMIENNQFARRDDGPQFSAALERGSAAEFEARVRSDSGKELIALAKKAGQQRDKGNDVAQIQADVLADLRRDIAALTAGTL